MSFTVQDSLKVVNMMSNAYPNFGAKDETSRKQQIGTYAALFKDYEPEDVFKGVSDAIKHEEYIPNIHTLLEYINKAKYESSLKKALSDGTTEKGIDSWHVYERIETDTGRIYKDRGRRFTLNAEGLYEDERTRDPNAPNVVLKIDIHTMKNHGYTKNATRPFSIYETQDAYNIGYEKTTDGSGRWIGRRLDGEIFDVIPNDAVMRFRMM